MLDAGSRTMSPADAAEPSDDRDRLTHASDDEPGIRRRRAGKGFFYVDSGGSRVGDAEVLDRIRKLAIPPAWTDVWIAANPYGHVQATGRDERGRKQYRYHACWTAIRDEAKYAGLAGFASALPALRSRVEIDLRRRNLERDKVLASVVWLLDNTLIRVGNATYARDNKSFGLTTLRRRHLAIEGSTLRFAFRGKSGKEWNLKLVDRRMARILRGIQEIPGQTLFKYLDESGERRFVRSEDVNAYIREATDGGFSSKHFRTWKGTIAAAEVFAETPLPETRREKARLTNGLIDAVAARLGNTRAVCRACYIHPAVFSTWESGELAEGLRAARRSFRKLPDGLDEHEMTVMRWLQRQERNAGG